MRLLELCLPSHPCNTMITWLFSSYNPVNTTLAVKTMIHRTEIELQLTYATGQSRSWGWGDWIALPSPLASPLFAGRTISFHVHAFHSILLSLVSVYCPAFSKEAFLFIHLFWSTLFGIGPWVVLRTISVLHGTTVARKNSHMEKN